jgi:hypothetical protein
MNRSSLIVILSDVTAPCQVCTDGLVDLEEMLRA